MRTMLRLCVAVAALAPLPGRAITFVPLGFLGGGTSSQASALSDDGTTVVGWGTSSSAPNEAFVWTAGGGIQGLGTNGLRSSFAEAVSGDGSVVVGSVRDARGDAQPFR